MKKDSLKNVLSFKEFDLNKLENKPGKIIEKSENKALERIMNHPIRKKKYETLLENNKWKANKYLKFWKNHEIAIPEWDNNISEFVDTNI